MDNDVELSDRNPGNTNRVLPNTADKPVAEKIDSPKNIVEKEEEKKKIPSFYTVPIFKPNKYEFY